MLGRCAAAGYFLTTHKSCSFASHVAVWIGDAFKQVRWSVQSTISKCKIFPRKNKTKYYTAKNFCKFSRKSNYTLLRLRDWTNYIMINSFILVSWKYSLKSRNLGLTIKKNYKCGIASPLHFLPQGSCSQMPIDGRLPTYGSTAN